MPARRAGLCCAARASRPASAVGVSSNVRPHQTPFRPTTERFSLQRPPTKLNRLSSAQATGGSRPPSPRKLVAAACKKTELLIAVPEDFVVKVTSKLHARLQEPQDRASARQFRNLINLERLFKLLGQAAGARRASLSEPLVRSMPRSGGVPPLLCRQPGRGRVRSLRAERTNFSSACTVRPNPSLSPRPTTAGRLARVARWFMLHHAGKPSLLRGRG